MQCDRTHMSPSMETITEFNGSSPANFWKPLEHHQANTWQVDVQQELALEAYIKAFKNKSFELSRTSCRRIWKFSSPRSTHVQNMPMPEARSLLKIVSERRLIRCCSKSSSIVPVTVTVTVYFTPSRSVFHYLPPTKWRLESPSPSPMQGEAGDKLRLLLNDDIVNKDPLKNPVNLAEIASLLDPPPAATRLDEHAEGSATGNKSKPKWNKVSDDQKRCQWEKCQNPTQSHHFYQACCCHCFCVPPVNPKPNLCYLWLGKLRSSYLFAHLAIMHVSDFSWMNGLCPSERCFLCR